MAAVMMRAGVRDASTEMDDEWEWSVLLLRWSDPSAPATTRREGFRSVSLDCMWIGWHGFPVMADIPSTFNWDVMSPPNPAITQRPCLPTRLPAFFGLRALCLVPHREP